MRKHQFFLIFLSTLTLIAVATGFILGGSPITQQAKRYDEIRLNAFSSIQSKIDNYYSTYKKLPQSFSDLTYSSYDRADLYNDPQTKKQYEYKLTSDTSYKLCAEFSTESDDYKQQNPPVYQMNETTNSSPIVPPDPYYKGNASHPKGPYCITYFVSNYRLTPTYTPYYLTPTVTPTPVGFRICEWVDDSKNSLLKGTYGRLDEKNGQIYLITDTGTALISYKNAKIYDNNCLATTVNKFTLYDNLRVEATTSVNNVYQAVQIQDLSR